MAAAEKRAIGTAAAALIPNNSSLFINIGTTTEEVANGLANHEDLLVITNNIHVAMLLYPRPRIEVIVAGGSLRRSDGGIVGSAAVGLIRQFKVDYAIIGASAIESDGTLLDFDYQEVQVAQSILENARHAMLVADCSKLETLCSSAHRPYQPGADLGHRRAWRVSCARRLPRTRGSTD